ncbi:protein kinase [Pseudosulfitobacter sp. DSM 107133]|uniref:serine/threonine protein kinase n=1 Tax=Pseudosulfitobacter sp. DSM 107133 TaxID=2883100 RepID=UPI000DF19C9A|nr:protein kinase [Pseudosulfitobacter sp. DSM 107133]UOA27130.1 Serine/threonine-protein kinase PrkC [Pseudosulfitobacter sp. DSM 107133]
MSGQPKSGDTLATWTLTKTIDAGGNADVWLAQRGDGQKGAIKILRNLKDETYARFRNEISALQKLGDIDGIIPMLESDFPEGKGARPWYAMPVAQSSRAFFHKADSAAIVKEFVRLGQTLAKLHALHIAHRDIKPENLLGLHGRLCFSDFGLVKYPDLTPITPEKRDVGAKFTMAPEMRREAAGADGLPADVFSFAKTLWIVLTGQSLGFDGPYIAGSNVGLTNFLGKKYTTILDNLLSDCTQHDPLARPAITEVVTRLNEWLEVVADFQLQNAYEWREFAEKFFPLQSPNEATWTGPDAIITVLSEIAKVPGLNHMFFPDGGGMTLKAVRRAAEPDFIDLDTDFAVLLKPAKLTYVSFGFDPNWDYLRLEIEPVNATGHYPVKPGDYVEHLSELLPGQYAHPDVYEYRFDRGRELPVGSRAVVRYLKGAMVFFSTSSPYNQNSATYDARHEKMSEAEFKAYMGRGARESREKASRA